MLYVITDGNHFKFGTSRKVYDRVKGLQTGNPRKLSVVATIPDDIVQRWWRDDYSCETMFHEMLEEYHVLGEWFRDHIAVRAVVDLIKADQYDWLTMMTYSWHETLHNITKRRLGT